MNHPRMSPSHGGRSRDEGRPEAARSGGALPRVTSAYNFAPLARQVVLPHWQDRVSHDLPLEEGLSAELVVQLEAHTPLLVGAERAGSGPQHPVEFFAHPDGTPAVPGSALRGLLRNVLEIASFSRLQLLDDRLLSMRDLYSKEYTSRFVKRAEQGGYAAASRAGWLRFDGDRKQWVIHECEVGRIEQSELDWAKSALEPGKTLHQRLVEAWEAAGRGKDKDAQRFARLKYEAVEGKVAFTFYGDRTPQPYRHQQGKLELHYRKLRLKNDCPDKVPGYLVLTGQPGRLDRSIDPKQHQSGTKHMEFVFIHDPAKTQQHVVESEVMRGFLSIYEHSSDLEYLQSPASPHAKRGVPVFFLTEPDAKTRQTRVASLGLSQMYRLPAASSLGTIAARQQAPRPQAGMRLDFAETLFGYATETDSLKGRLSCGDLRLTGTERGDALLAEPRFMAETVLGQPKPGFYPNYLQQPGADARGDVAGEQVTPLSPNAALRGWKRYPVRPLAEVKLQPPPGPGQAVNTRLRPLKPGVRFEGVLRLHNVMPEELGALVWALEWGGQPELRHALGLGKSFGLGQVSLKVVRASIRSNDPGREALTPEACRRRFERYMEEQVPGWIRSPSMTELLAMADPRLPQANRTTLAPLKLEMQGANGFAEVKKRNQRAALLPYSKLKA